MDFDLRSNFLKFLSSLTDSFPTLIATEIGVVVRLASSRVHSSQTSTISRVSVPEILSHHPWLLGKEGRWEKGSQFSAPSGSRYLSTWVDSKRPHLEKIRLRKTDTRAKRTDYIEMKGLQQKEKCTMDFELKFSS
jgi:hypothetical protein